jgi:hypothetical protein
MNPTLKKTTPTGSTDISRRRWIPLASAVGAFSAFVGAALRTGPSPVANPQTAVSAYSPDPQPATRYEREYSASAVLGGSGSAHPFQRSLAGVAVGAGDRIFALGDGDVRIFEPDGGLVLGWKAAEAATCLTVGPDGRVYVGAPGRVEIYGPAGNRAGGFAAVEAGRPADITAIKVFRKEILVADAAARFIRRYDAGGRQLGAVGTRSKTGSFMLPNRWLDFDVDTKGVIRATDTGRHLVTAWALDGTPLGSFGKFGMKDPADFAGCCNPVNLALTPDGKIVTGEKMIARVKVYEPEGRLIAVIGAEHFDPACTHIYLAVDSKGRILAADPVRRLVKIFLPVPRKG